MPGRLARKQKGPRRERRSEKKGEDEEEEPSNDVDGNGQILCFESAEAHSDDYRWQESAKAVEKNILHELNQAASFLMY